MLPLCYTCFMNEQQEACTGKDEAWAIMCTWFMPEIQVTVNKGYELLAMF